MAWMDIDVGVSESISTYTDIEKAKPKIDTHKHQYNIRWLEDPCNLFVALTFGWMFMLALALAVASVPIVGFGFLGICIPIAWFFFFIWGVSYRCKRVCNKLPDQL